MIDNFLLKEELKNYNKIIQNILWDIITVKYKDIEELLDLLDNILSETEYVIADIEYEYN